MLDTLPVIQYHFQDLNNLHVACKYIDKLAPINKIQLIMVTHIIHTHKYRHISIGCENQIIEKEDYTVEGDNRTNEYHIHRNGGHMYRAINYLLQINNLDCSYGLIAWC